MTVRQTELVQATWERLSRNADGFAALFYQRLFEVKPQLKPLFKGDMDEQRSRLVTMITAAVEGLNDFDKLKPAIQKLGQRHSAYGVQPEHYEAVGEALLWTLERWLGRGFTDEANVAWAAFYGRVAAAMQTHTQ